MASVPAPEYLHTVAHSNPRDPFGDLMKRDVIAAYFVEGGAFTLFKNAAHEVVFAMKTDLVLLIERRSSS
jgi:hypothetical protein